MIACQTLAARSDGQQVRFPSPPLQPVPGTAAYQPAGTYPPTPYPYAQPPTNVYPPPTALPPTAQPQAMQNLVGDAQRYGIPFDPYAQPAQYTTPIAPPPGAVPYATPGPPPPLMPFPSLSPSWGGFYAGFEATILEARTGNISIPFATGYPLGGVDVPVTSLDFFPDFGLEFSPRVWAGYKGAAGFGVRGRWWYYSHGAPGMFSFNGLDLNTPLMIDTDVPPDGMADQIVTLESTSLNADLKINSIDMEATQDGEFHNWDFQIAGGVRYAKIDYDLTGMAAGTVGPIIGPPAPWEETISALSEFQGVGPTVAMSGRRPLLSIDGLAFLINLRLAFLFGDTDASIVTAEAFPDPIRVTVQEHLVQVWEVQVGFEYSRLLQNGARLFGGAFLEAQAWEWNTPLGLTGSDLGFFGPTITVGLAR